MLNCFFGIGELRQILLGRQKNYLQGDGEMNALFSGIQRAQTPLGGLFPSEKIFFDKMTAVRTKAIFPL